jgi:TPR repeat protein
MVQYDLPIIDRKVDAVSLVKDPLVVSADLTIKFPQHFYRGCAYTISSWMYLYRPAKKNYETVIFTTSTLSGTPGGWEPEDAEKTTLPPAMLPFILTGVGEGDDKHRFFMGLTRDGTGQYHGFWARSGAPVPYEEWFHLSLTIAEDNTVSLYMNGELLGSTLTHYEVGPKLPNGSQKQRYLCPYNRKVEESDIEPFESLNEYQNNSALFLLNSHNNVVTSTSGLIQHALVVRNHGLSQKMTHRLRQSTKPPQTTFLTHLLRSYGHYSLEGLCPLVPFEHHDALDSLKFFYLELSWGLCPQQVCGPVCVSPQFLLGIRTREVYFFYGGPYDAALEEGVSSKQHFNTEVPAMDGLPVVHADGMRRKRRLLWQSLSDGDSNSGSDSSTDGSNSRVYANTDAADQQLVVRLVIWVREMWNLVYHSLSWSYPYFTSPEYLAAVGGEDDYHVDSHDYYAEEQQWKKVRYLTGRVEECNIADRDPRLDFATPKELKRRRLQRAVHDMYHCGMVWLHGSYYHREANKDQSLLYETELCDWLVEPLVDNDGVDLEVRRPRKERAQALERSMSAFTVASWFADELLAEYPPRVPNQPWSFRVSPLLMQPIHQALAYRYGFDNVEQVRLPEDLGVLLQDSLAEKVNIAAFYTDVLNNNDSRENSRRVMSSEAIVYAEGNVDSMEATTASATTVERTLYIQRVDGVFRAFANNPLQLYLDELNSANGGVDNAHQGTHGRFSLRAMESVRWDEFLVALSNTLASEDGVGPAVMLEKNPPAAMYDTIAQQAMERETFSNIIYHTSALDLPSRFTDAQQHDRDDAFWDTLMRNKNKGKDYSRSPDRDMQNVAGPDGSLDVLPHERRRKSKSGGISAFGSQSGLDMHAAAAHYFPVAQYAAAHYGVEGSGVGFVEEIFVSHPDDFWMQTGAEDNPMIQYEEAEAAGGDVNAQLQMARRHYWGNQGLEPQPQVARQWYERAAEEHNNPEANYNLGVLHANGQAGLKRNGTRALEYFKKAADPEDGQESFSMALYAMGNHHLHEQPDFDKAIDYLMRGSHLGSTDAHFTLATMYIDRLDVETGIVHLIQAANAQHVRALNYLAHGLIDPDSWLFMHRRRSLAKARAPTQDADPLMVDSPPNPKGHWARKRAQELEKLKGTASSWKYDPTQPLDIYLTNGVVRIPQPLGSGNTISAAMHILKAISAMTYRINDLLRVASVAYNEERDLEALEHFSEAAELGLLSAQDNAAFILEGFETSACHSSGAKSPSMMGLDGVPIMRYQAVASSFNFTSAVSCRRYFKSAATRRYTQLANNGDVNAKKVLARQAISGSNLRGNGTVNLTEAALLFTYAAEQGDVESLMDLGWLYLNPAFPYHSRNITAMLFKSAGQWEKGTTTLGDDAAGGGGGEDPADSIMGSLGSVGTLGLAPALASFYVTWQPWWQDSWVHDLARIPTAWRVFLTCIYNEGHRYYYGEYPPVPPESPYLYPQEQPLKRNLYHMRDFDVGSGVTGLLMGLCIGLMGARLAMIVYVYGWGYR